MGNITAVMLKNRLLMQNANVRDFMGLSRIGRLKEVFRRPEPLVFHQNRTPGKTAADAFEQEVLSAFDLAVFNTDI